MVDLLLEILPFVMKQNCFALKGGTAINLFVNDMPRYSVDIDLTYLPLEERNESLENIRLAVEEIQNDITQSLPGVQVNPHSNSKLIVNTKNAEVKIEPNLILRGSVFPVEEMTLCQKAENEFRKTMSVKCLSKADLYGGKICAALDRQHPRDLFDIKVLNETVGITKDIKNAFIVYLVSSPRPIHELLHPNLIDQRDVYEREFKEMAVESISYEELESVRVALVYKINSLLTEKDKTFLISIKEGVPQWDLFDVKGIESLPGVKWKLLNIKRLSPIKHRVAIDKLRTVLFQNK